MTYSVEEVSKILDVNAETVRRWIRSGRLKAEQRVKRGSFTISETELRRFCNTSKYSMDGCSTLKEGNKPRLMETKRIIYNIQKEVEYLNTLIDNCVN